MTNFLIKKLLGKFGFLISLICFGLVGGMDCVCNFNVASRIIALTLSLLWKRD